MKFKVQPKKAFLGYSGTIDVISIVELTICKTEKSNNISTVWFVVKGELYNLPLKMFNDCFDIKEILPL